MRKFLALLIAVLMLVVAVVPVSAQGTIVDLAAGNEDLSTLVTAVQAADPAVAETLSGRGQYTAFAPTNTAFVNLANFFDFELEALLADQGLLTQLLLYHVVDGEFFSGAVAGLDGTTVPTLLEGTAVGITVNDDGSITLNGVADVVVADVNASNGVVHVIDQVIFPGVLRDRLAALADVETGAAAPAEEEAEEAGPTIADIVVENENFSTLLALIQAADPAVLETLSGAGEFTVFAPTNEAFDALFGMLGLTADDVISLGGADLITPVLLYHAAEGVSSAADLVAIAREGGEVTTLEGTAVALTLGGNGLTLNGEINTVRVNIETSNGIIHVINGVLLPEQTIQVLSDLGLL